MKPSALIASPDALARVAMSRRGATTSNASSSSASRRRASSASTATRAKGTSPFVLLALVGAVVAPLLARALGGKRSSAPPRDKTARAARAASAKPAASTRSSSSLPRNKASNNKKNKARRAEKREVAEARRREEELRAKREQEKAKKGGNNVPKVRFEGVPTNRARGCVSRNDAKRPALPARRADRRLTRARVRSLAQDKDMIGGEAGKTFTTTSHVKVSSWAHDIDARRAAGS